MTETPAAAVTTETSAASVSIREGVLNAFEEAAEEATVTEPAPTPEIPTPAPVATTTAAPTTKKHEKSPEKAASKPSKPTTTSNTPKPSPKPTPTPKSTPSPTPPPRECTEEEYSELQEIASSLTLEEATEELLDAARYGELDSVRALLEHHNHAMDSQNLTFNLVNRVDPRDDTQNTALHKACANG
eukprot:CAMPEP_0194384480 /NCGR_PEP_ID=MMETSP0174-20130528/74300_1 /TAXON_ID=216777 /ORGANISM="Proboscia alata, Strain PI-D3" /LENGTH=186 /DNA_ID=CAMNT_0039171697 /DNA_START=6 /DNA_END=562 /DNA_ORIENTATION=-